MTRSAMASTSAWPAQNFDGEAAAVRPNPVSLVRLASRHFAARGFLVVDFARFCSALPRRLALSG